MEKSIEMESFHSGPGFLAPDRLDLWFDQIRRDVSARDVLMSDSVRGSVESRG